MPSDTFLPEQDLPEAEELPQPPAEGPGLFGDVPAPGAPPAQAAPEPAQPYRVLARKYRPATFADLIGQEAMVRTLRNAFAQDRVAHAFMLTGVRGVGKTTTARIIARALNCTGPDGTGGPTVDPCGVCADCRAILLDRHPDVLELDAASNNGVDNVRELREQVRFRPVQGRSKVFILDEVHMLSGPAFNALLKTLEEPPPAVRFLFATTELRKVPATILSRCQTFHLRRVPQEALRAHFAAIAGREGAVLEPEALGMIARAADGSVRDGLSLLDQAIALVDGGLAEGGLAGGVPAGGGGTVTAQSVRDMLGLADRALVMDVMEAAMRGDVAATLAHVDRAHEGGADAGVLLADLAELTHQLTRLRTVPGLRDDPTLPEEMRARGATLAGRLSVPVLGRAWQMLLKGLEELAFAPDRRAAAEMVLIRLAHVAEMPTPGEVLRQLTDGPGAMGGAAPAAGGTGGGASPGGGPPPVVGDASEGGSGMSRAGSGRAVPGNAGAVTMGGAATALAATESAALPVVPAPQPGSFREVLALASGRKPVLHAMLRQSVHLVAFAPGRIEFRPRPDAPRDLAAQLTALLLDATGQRWTIVLSNAPGEPTVAEQGRAVAAEGLEAAGSHPLVRAVLAAFPGARIAGEVRDGALDDYGLPLAAAVADAGAGAEPDEAGGPDDPFGDINDDPGETDA